MRHQDIVPDNRIVYTYEMPLDGWRISVSLATIELFPNAAGTRTRVVEDGALLNGLDNVEQREDGTRFLLDQLEASLDA